MGEYCCRIERLKNGYEVELKDPKLVKANRGPGAYRDPMVSYAFNTVEDVLKFLKKNLDKALPDDEFSSSFDEAATEKE